MSEALQAAADAIFDSIINPRGWAEVERRQADLAAGRCGSYPECIRAEMTEAAFWARGTRPWNRENVEHAVLRARNWARWMRPRIHE